MKKKKVFHEFDRQEIYDENLTDDIKKGIYPDLKVKKLKNGKYVFSQKKDSGKLKN